MQTQLTAAPRITAERAQRLFRAYACKAARAIALNDPDGIHQARRQLAVRLWADVDPLEFSMLADNIHELRSNRRTGWDTQWESPGDKELWLARLRETINAEINALAYMATRR